MSFFDFAWLIPLIPLVAFVTIVLLAHRDPGSSQRIAVLGIWFSSALAVFLFLAMVVTMSERGQISQSLSIHWLAVGNNSFSLGIHIDPVGAVILLALAPICWTIFYVAQDEPSHSLFFAFLSLLAASMLGLFVFDNLLIFFIFWEIMDISAYMLIGFRRERGPAFEASLEAFLTTQVGNLLLLLGLVLLYTKVGSLAYADVFSDTDRLKTLGQIDLLGAQFPATAMIAALFLVGAVGKSAQFPLHTWLPKATEAPAPASALIHVAATTAGVFLFIRAFPLFDAAAASLMVPNLDMSAVTLIGIVSAAFAALVGITQRDIRRALSFAAVGQLGYVLVALGMGAYTAGVFHLLTSVFANVLLFLAAGAVSRGMAHASQQAESGGEAVDTTDMLNMGGLGRKRTGLFWAFFIGAVTLAGLPLATAGFWSKDAILLRAWEHSPALFWTLAAINGLITFGAIRLVCLIFIGKPRTQAAEHAPQHTPAIGTPLIILSAIVLFLGWAGKQLPLAGGNWLASFLGIADATEFNLEPALYWSALSVGGLTMSVLIYGWIPVRPGEADPLEAAVQKMWLGWLYRWAYNGFYVDRLYRWAFGNVPIGLARLCDILDRVISNGLTSGVAWLGRRIPPLFAWADTHLLDAFVNLLGRAGQILSTASGWLDPHWNRIIDMVSPAIKYLAHAGSVLDRQLDRLVGLAQPGVLVLVKLSTHVDRGLDFVVNGVGRAVETGGLWFRPKTGHIQDYLRLAVIAMLVLIVVFVFLFSQI